MKKKIDTIRKEVTYPAEITFKSIFRFNSNIVENIEMILAENGISGAVSNRVSRKNTFISYTISAEFSSEKILHDTCHKISIIKGFMMMI